MPKAINLTSTQVEELKQLIADGTTQQNACKHFGISESKLAAICKENNIERKWVREYTCVLCGKVFKASHKSAICPECKATPNVCVICGKAFPKKYFPYNQKTCSAKCRGAYRAQSGTAKAGAQKMKETKMERYGTLDPAEVTKKKKGGELDPKICPLCGKEFVPDTPRQVYCKDVHYVPCPVCGKMTELKDISIGPQACSEGCRMARINQTCLERYGNKDAVNSEHAKKLGKQTSLRKYGKEYYMQTDKAKQHYKDVIQERYGVTAPIAYPEFKEKAKRTNLEKYGTEYASQSEEIKEKVRQTNQELYGGAGFASPILRKRITETNKERYGVEFPVSSPEIRQKISQSLRDNYGVDNFWKTKEDLARRIKDPRKIDDYYAFKQDPRGYVESHYEDKPPIYVLADDLGVTDTPIYDILINAKCQDVIDRTKQSSMEYEIEHLLRKLVPDAEIWVNCRRVLPENKEIDFYLPEYKFGIECNPTITHNSTVSAWNPGVDPALPVSYHKQKSEQAMQVGVFLFHIFGYEWTNKRAIIESMIANILGKNTNKVYARNTQIIQVDAPTAKKFLDDNHRQGGTNAPIRLGLKDKITNELVSLMTFGKTRPSIGKEQDALDTDYELIRFCNKLGTSVVGGASKLFKHFLSEYAPTKVISFSDIAHTKGGLYRTLGFKDVSHSDPGYVWVKHYTDEYRNRVSCQKANLLKMFDDVTEEDIETKSERKIMIDHKYVQVYDSGVIRWEYTPVSLNSAEDGGE